MKNHELEALKNLVASFADVKESDQEVGACASCCTQYNGGNF